MNWKHKKIYTLIAIGIIIVIILAVLFINHIYLNLHTILNLFNPKVDHHYLKTQIRHSTPLDALMYVGLLGLVSAIPGIPNWIFAIMAGVFFGGFLGTLMNVAGLTIGNLIGVSAIKLTHELIKRQPNENKWLQALMNMRHKRLGLTIGYAVPFIPSWFANLTAVRLKTSLPIILLCAFIGNLPTSIIYAFGGNALLKGNLKQSMGIISFVLILAVLIIFIRRDRQLHERVRKITHATGSKSNH